ncbi:MAG: hypothetical protein A3B90_03195 [Candidatus Magasanikbacteria bacterium RIFCSPHIGHO2_02_FULL_41_13]|uniref:Lipoprotein n=1 Tax=Candidatus Magasanikbacteria bacterium RIFCSPHIGHO2_02_FULL_41_13 TaxID=1798676 RepID=A0A1F6M2K4_9BACT|nr:MAG: hypothetical protein A3B90_03195 [Candidatus Magasanikbacteria bacterium RIFCSPHIGHO2_02_FULL_41_13]
MQKIFFLFLFISTFLFLGAGCQTQVNTFDVSSSIPPDARDVNVQDIDFSGDGKPEKVVYYKNDQTVNRESTTTFQHLVLFGENNSKWQVIREDAFANNNTTVERILADYKVIDFGNDGKQELFVQWSPERPLVIGTYYIVALVNGEYKFIDEPMLNQLEYLNVTNDEVEMYLVSVTPTKDGVKESYDIYCKKDLEGKSMADRYAISCRSIVLTSSFQGGTLMRQ